MSLAEYIIIGLLTIALFLNIFNFVRDIQRNRKTITREEEKHQALICDNYYTHDHLERLLDSTGEQLFGQETRHKK